MRIRLRTSAEIAPDVGGDQAVRANVRQDDIDESYSHDVHSVLCRRSYESAASAILAYKIFPASTMTSRVCSPTGRAEVGAAIVQRIHVAMLSLETHVVVSAVHFDEQRTSLSYATSEGHPEMGIATFSVERRDKGCLLTVETWSKPGNILTRLARPISRFLQQRLTRDAMRRFAEG